MRRHFRANRGGPNSAGSSSTGTRAGRAAERERMVLGDGALAGIGRYHWRRNKFGERSEAVASFGPDDIVRLLADPGIVRNRAKVEAAIANARAALRLPGGLASLVWQYAGDEVAAPVSLADVPAVTSESSRRRSVNIGIEWARSARSVMASTT